MLNLSLQTGHFTDSWKEAFVIPLLKKCGLEFAYNNLRPISNLSYISKLVETAVADLENNNLYSDLQSSYRKYYGTETALLKVRNDILLNMNQQRVTLLITVDLSAALDTVHHECLLNILNSKLGLDSIALQWFDSYLKNRSYRVSVIGELSKSFYSNVRTTSGLLSRARYYLTSMLVAYSTF